MGVNTRAFNQSAVAEAVAWGFSVSDKNRDGFQLVRSLELPLGDYAIFGSGPLIVRGVIAATNDIDIVSRGDAWERARTVGDLVLLPEYDVEIVTCFDGIVTGGPCWAIGGFDIDDLIDTAEMIEGLPFVGLEHVVCYKQIAGRPKDLEHLRLYAEAVRDATARPGTTATDPAPR